MSKYIKTFENFDTIDVDFLYHGTSYENVINIMKNGFNDDTYWGDMDTAKDYAYSYKKAALIKIPYNELKYSIEPNTTLINFYEYNKETDSDYAEITKEWENSDKTALDSLNIIGSVILPPCSINFNISNVIKL